MVEPSGTVAGPVGTSLPSLILTFLIADVRSYTTFTNEQGVSAAAQLADRFAVLCRAVVSRHGGEVRELRGDEALAVFSSPRAALLAAVELQGRFRQEWEADPSLPLRVGMGIDVGEVAPVQGGYRGKALNLAARLCSLAGPGEVFASEDVVQQAERIEGLAYVERGRVQLKGFEDPIRVIHVLPQEDLPEHFLPLVSLVAKPSNLPVQTTPFIGRERELGEVVALLRQPAIRLLTLSGAGGTGKTRLALQVGVTVLEEYERGVFFVNLAPLADPALVPSTIAATFKLKEVPGQEITQTLIEYLEDRQLLLVLDNFEHLLPAATVVHGLLVDCPRLTILVTSRASLRLSAEHEYGVPPLGVPDSGQLPGLERLTQYDAVAFFIERAQAVQPSFQVTNENAPAVAEICIRLDGLPLAIELAAARIKLFAPGALLARLSRRLKLLTGGAIDRPGRQQTLRNTLDWSHSLLSADERTLFARLSVFAGGCSLEDAEAICNPQGELDLLQGIASLVEQSLLWREDADESRFSLLETIREYAAEKLEEQGAGEAVRLAHAARFLQLAQEAEPQLRGPNQGEWFARLEAEHDNLRAALGWLLERGQAEQGLRLAVAISYLWHMRGYLSEGRRWLEAGLALGEGTPGEVRAGALNWVAHFMGARGELERATELLQEALALFRVVGDQAGNATALLTLGSVVQLQGDTTQATRYCQESLQVFREVGDRQGTVDALSALGLIAAEEGEFEVGEALDREAIALARAIGDWGNVAICLNNLGCSLLEQGKSEEAGVALEESLALARELGLKSMLPAFLDSLACVAMQQGDHERAAALFAEGLALSYKLGIRWVLLYILGHMAELATLQGDAARAARLAGAELAGRASTGMVAGPAEQNDGEQVLRRVREELGDEAFLRTWEAGRAMRLDEAVAYALDEPG